MSTRLAVHGGPAAVTVPMPHFVWPPVSTVAEGTELAAQRDLDISIKGRSGPIKQLEEAFSEFLEGHRRFVISFNSGTSALLAAYIGIGLQAGDEVIVPAITYHAAVSPLYFWKVNPVLVDVDPDSWCLNPALIEAAITPRTKAITVVHQWGHPADMAAIMELAAKYGLRVIEDCSHAHGSRIQGRLVGTFGDAAVFSLQANKMIFAGEGGLLVTNDAEVHDRATLLGHYRDRARDEIVDPFYQQFWVTGYGLKLRMSPYNAVTALHSLEAFPDRKRQRHQALSYFRAGLNQLPELNLPTPAPEIDLGAWYGFKPIYDASQAGGWPRSEYIAALQAEGVDVGEPGSPAFSQLPYFQIVNDKLYRHRRKKVYRPGQFPVAERLAAAALSLPTFTNWPEDQGVIDQYLAAMAKVGEWCRHHPYRGQSLKEAG